MQNKSCDNRTAPFFTSSPAVLHQKKPIKNRKKNTGTPEHLVHNSIVITLQNIPDQVSHPDRNGHFFKRSLNNFLSHFKKALGFAYILDQ